MAESSTKAQASSPGAIVAPVSGVKGAAVRAALRWVTTTYGPTTAQAIYDGSSPALRALLTPGLSTFGVVSTAWYDVALVGELLDVIRRATQAKRLVDHDSQMADAVAADNVDGVYRSLFRLIATRSLLLAHADRVYTHYFNSGHLDVASAREGEFVLTNHGAKVHHPSLCLITSQVLEKILLRVGYKGATLERIRCRGTGQGDCVFEVDYVV